MRSIKEVRLELSQWGGFWARQEEGQGYASKSNVEQLRETLRAGCSTQGTGFMVSHCADSIYVPEHIGIIDAAINNLNFELKIVLRHRYVMKNRLPIVIGGRKLSVRDFRLLVLKAEGRLI